jgi:phage shock protein E
MNLFIGLAFAFQNPFVAYVLGGTLATLQITVITTHYCVGSLLYELALKLLGRAEKLVPIDQAREMVNSGAHLVDVREPDEFASGHLDGAVNIPVDQVAQHLEKFRAQPSILYCRSGMRCQNAIQILRRLGIENAHNLGPMSRW